MYVPIIAGCAMRVRDALRVPMRLAGALAEVLAHKRADEALRLSEERYARAMQASNGGLWEWNPITDEMFMSDRARELFGLPHGLHVRTRTELKAHGGFHPDDLQRTEDAIQSTRSPQSKGLDIEYRVVNPGGELRWVRSRGKLFFDERGAPMLMTGCLTDITERKAAADALRHKEEELRRAQRLEAVGTFAGGIAHDFNNILGAVLGYGDMALRYAPQGSQLHRDLDKIMTAGERGRALVDRILAFSRSGVRERVAVHVEAVVREALDLLSARLPGNVRVEIELPGGRAAVLGDPTQVHQILMNLATNAIQAMASGGVLRVSLETLRLDAPRLATTGVVRPGEFVVLKVADSGMGITPEILQRIFDPFFTTKEAGVGTGLGLSLVHGIVAELGGAIDVASTPGKGSAFVAYLPRAGDAAEDRRSEQAKLPRGDGQRVLVVDDEELLLNLATRTLEDLGYAPVGFASSAAALDAFRKDPGLFDAIVTDERMPGLCGSALIREVRRIRRVIPILLMSGYVGGEVTALALEAGADEVLKKPLRARDLALTLARINNDSR